MWFLKKKITDGMEREIYSLLNTSSGTRREAFEYMALRAIDTFKEIWINENPIFYSYSQLHRLH